MARNFHVSVKVVRSSSRVKNSPSLRGLGIKITKALECFEVEVDEETSSYKFIMVADKDMMYTGLLGHDIMSKFNFTSSADVYKLRRQNSWGCTRTDVYLQRYQCKHWNTSSFSVRTEPHSDFGTLREYLADMLIMCFKNWSTRTFWICTWTTSLFMRNGSNGGEEVSADVHRESGDGVERNGSELLFIRTSLNPKLLRLSQHGER